MIWQLIDSGGVGGAERYIATVSASLKRRGLDSTIVLYEAHGANPWLEQLASEGLPYRVLAGSFADLVRQMRQERPRIVHTHGYKAGFLGRLAGLLAGVPSVSTFHSGARSPLPVGFYEWLDEYTAVLSQRIAVSDHVHKRLPFGSTVLTNYIPAPQRTFTVPLPRTIGFVGRLSEEKCPDLFCSLARQASQAGAWHVWGDGPMRAELEREFGDVVTFHGAVADMAPVWAQLGLLVMPSRFEGLPYAGLEALAAGVPILASRVGGLPSLVREGVTGWLFEAGDMEGALRGVRRWRALMGEQLLDIRNACLDHLHATFCEDEHVDGLLQVYGRAGLVIGDQRI